MAGTGTALLVAAGLVFFFAHLIRLALMLAAVGFVLGFAASVAFGYEELGKDKIRPELVKAQTELSRLAAAAAQFQIDAAVAQKKAVDANRAKNAALTQLKAKEKELLDAQDKLVANAPVGGAAGVFLNTVIANVNDSSFGPGAGDSARAAAAISSASVVRQWEEWGAYCANEYGKVSARVDGLQTYVNGLNAAGQRAVGN
jgi:hypothetical protein